MCEYHRVHVIKSASTFIWRNLYLHRGRRGRILHGESHARPCSRQPPFKSRGCQLTPQFWRPHNLVFLCADSEWKLNLISNLDYRNKVSQQQNYTIWRVYEVNFLSLFCHLVTLGASIYISSKHTHSLWFDRKGRRATGANIPC